MTPAAIWRELLPEHRRWIIVNALLITAVINLVVNFSIDLLNVAGKDSIPFWGWPLVETSTFWTLVGTLFLLPLVTCLLTTTVVRSDLREGNLPPLHGLAHSEELPYGRLRRGAVIGGVVAGVGTPVIMVLLALLGVRDLSEGQYVFGQTVFAILLGALVTPVIALCAMTDEPPPE